MLDDTKKLVNELKAELLALYEKGRDKGYDAKRFRAALNKADFITEISKFLEGDGVPDGFVDAYMIGGKELTVESVVIKEKYQKLFTKEVIDRSRKRLGE